MSEENQFNFQIKGIEILDSSMISPKKKIDKNIIFGFDLQLQHSFNLQRELAIVTCKINIFDNDSKDKFGHINASCLYYVENLEQYIDKEKNNYNLPEGAVVMLNTVSISTVRGVMYGMFRGTFLNGAILPIVYPTSQIKKQSKSK